MKIDSIHDSFLNGQKKQAVQQIKRYGFKRFLINYLELLENLYTFDVVIYWYKGFLKSYESLS